MLKNTSDARTVKTCGPRLLFYSLGYSAVVVAVDVEGNFYNMEFNGFFSCQVSVG